MKKHVPSDLDIQVNTLINEKFGVAEGSGVREICREVYELLKTHISGSIRPDGTQILDPKLYQIWHLSKTERNVDISQRPLYCLVHMAECMKAPSSANAETFWYYLLDSITCYNVQPEPVSDWQCRLFVAFFELGETLWPEEVSSSLKNNIG